MINVSDFSPLEESMAKYLPCNSIGTLVNETIPSGCGIG
jgi:hypothetical protein